MVQTLRNRLEILSNYSNEKLIISESMDDAARAAVESGTVLAVFIDEATKVVVQGLTGREGKFHALRNREYGTKVVAGTRPGKGGEEVEGIPIFNTVKDAVKETGANTAMTFVPPAFAMDAVLELVTLMRSNCLYN